jgi:hypothetical protein
MANQKTRSRRDPDGEVTTHEQELAEYLQERIRPGLNRGAIPLLARSIAKEIVRLEHLNGGSDDPEASDEHDEEPAAEADDEPDAEADDEGDESTAEADDEADDEPEDESDYEADDEPEDEPDDEADDEADEDEPDDEADEGPGNESESPLEEFEAEMHELQAELGEDWILRFSVQGDEAWLTAEKEDGSQHVEAPTAELLAEAVELLNEGDGRSD